MKCSHRVSGFPPRLYTAASWPGFSPYGDPSRPARLVVRKLPGPLPVEAASGPRRRSSISGGKVIIHDRCGTSSNILMGCLVWKIGKTRSASASIPQVAIREGTCRPWIHANAGGEARPSASAADPSHWTCPHWRTSRVSERVRTGDLSLFVERAAAFALAMDANAAGQDGQERRPGRASLRRPETWPVDSGADRPAAAAFNTGLRQLIRFSPKRRKNARDGRGHGGDSHRQGTRRNPVGAAARVVGLRLRVGRWSGVEPESLHFCLEALTDDTELNGCRLGHQMVEPEFQCGQGMQRYPATANFVPCPSAEARPNWWPAMSSPWPSSSGGAVREIAVERKVPGSKRRGGRGESAVVSEKGAYVVNLISSPGSGKDDASRGHAGQLGNAPGRGRGRRRPDGQRRPANRDHGRAGGGDRDRRGCHLDASMVRKAYRSLDRKLPGPWDLLIIEKRGKPGVALRPTTWRGTRRSPS